MSELLTKDDARELITQRTKAALATLGDQVLANYQPETGIIPAEVLPTEPTSRAQPEQAGDKDPEFNS